MTASEIDAFLELLREVIDEVESEYSGWDEASDTKE